MSVKPEDIDEEYMITPKGVLMMCLGSEEIAQLACSALARHMRQCARFIYVDDEGLHFESTLDDDDSSDES